MSQGESSAKVKKVHKRPRDEEDPPLEKDVDFVVEEGVQNGAEGEEGAGPSRKSVKKKRKTKTPGIIYISRIPPGMTPQKVKHLMGRWGEVGKVYAHRRDAPDGPRHTQNSKQKQRNAKYDEAWIEFMDKEVAKTVARMLNAEIIGGKKGDRWREEIWTMKYLSGFKWEMLGEQVAYERQAHQARLRNEIAKAKTEQEEYLRNVELARVLELRKARKKGGAVGKKASGNEPKDGRERFPQRQVASRGKEFEEKGMSDVLGSVFG